MSRDRTENEDAGNPSDMPAANDSIFGLMSGLKGGSSTRACAAFMTYLSYKDVIRSCKARREMNEQKARGFTQLLSCPLCLNCIEEDTGNSYARKEDGTVNRDRAALAIRLYDIDFDALMTSGEVKMCQVSNGPACTHWWLAGTRMVDDQVFKDANGTELGIHEHIVIDELETVQYSNSSPTPFRQCMITMKNHREYTEGGVALYLADATSHTPKTVLKVNRSICDLVLSLFMHNLPGDMRRTGVFLQDGAPTVLLQADHIVVRCMQAGNFGDARQVSGTTGLGQTSDGDSFVKLPVERFNSAVTFMEKTHRSEVCCGTCEDIMLMLSRFQPAVSLEAAVACFRRMKTGGRSIEDEMWALQTHFIIHYRYMTDAIASSIDTTEHLDVQETQSDTEDADYAGDQAPAY